MEPAAPCSSVTPDIVCFLLYNNFCDSFLTFHPISLPYDGCELSTAPGGGTPGHSHPSHFCFSSHVLPLWAASSQMTFQIPKLPLGGRPPTSGNGCQDPWSAIWGQSLWSMLCSSQSGSTRIWKHAVSHRAQWLLSPTTACAISGQH